MDAEFRTDQVRHVLRGLDIPLKFIREEANSYAADKATGEITRIHLERLSNSIIGEATPTPSASESK